MTNSQHQLNALREGGSSAHSVRSKRRVLQGKIVGGSRRSFEQVPKPQIDLLNLRESLKRRRMYDQYVTDSLAAGIESAQEDREYHTATQLESSRNSAACSQLEADSIEQNRVAKALALSKQRAVAEAMHSGKAVAFYATALIRFADDADLDPETAAFYKSVVRRLARGAMMDYEAAALGPDFDPSTFGDAS